MGHSWYMAVDMQLFVASPLILIPLHHYKRKFLPIIILLIGISLGSTVGSFIYYGQEVLE